MLFPPFNDSAGATRNGNQGARTAARPQPPSGADDGFGDFTDDIPF